MKVLLDENLPRPLKYLLPGHDVRTVTEMGWAGEQNGALLQLAATDFDVLLTADRGLIHQQNVGTAGIAVVVLAIPNTKLETVSELIPEVLAVLAEASKSASTRVVGDHKLRTLDSEL